MTLTLTMLMHNGCNPTALHPISVKSTATHNLYEKTSILMPGNVQIHRQVLLNDATISKETKIAPYNLLQKYDIIISKSDNNIDQIDTIKMHIATRPYAAPIAAQPYPLTLKHHGFLNKKLKIYWMQE